MVNGGGPTLNWIFFQYERRPIFCYWSGKLNHNERDCKLWLNSKGTLRKEDQQYGAWLWATTTQFYRSSPTPQQEGNHTNDTQIGQSDRLRLMITLVDEGTEHVGDGQQSTTNTVNQSIMEARTEQTGHTVKDIPSNSTLFQSHLQEIDQGLN